MKVFVTKNRVPDAIALLQNHFDVEVWTNTEPPSPAMLAKKASESEGILSEIDNIIDHNILASKTLKIVANRAVGMDNINIPEATKQGVFVSNTPGILHDSCADFTMGLILSIGRNVVFGDRQIRAGEWKVFDQGPYVGTDIHGATLGIIGLGAIGKAVAQRALGFGMRVLYFSKTRKPESEKELGLEWAGNIHTLLNKSDFISVHVPYSKDTRHLIDTEEFHQMKNTSFLINTSRGGTVNPKALYKAVACGNIAGAALDVTEPEPIDPDDPLLTLPNIIITPHIASASSATFRRMGIMAARNIIECLNGEPMTSCVNPEAFKGAKSR